MLDQDIIGILSHDPNTSGLSLQQLLSNYEKNTKDNADALKKYDRRTKA